jgi:hypothetical protein
VRQGGEGETDILNQAAAFLSKNKITLGLALEERRVFFGFVFNIFICCKKARACQPSSL